MQQMAVTSTQIALNSATATEIHAGTAIIDLWVSGLTWIGPSGVTAATGVPLQPGAPFHIDLGAGDALYGIAALRPDQTSTVAYVLTAS
jgi:hypothetical protein